MANTTIQLKRSGTVANAPTSLDYGELAINYADGLLYYKNSTGQIVSFSSGGNSFGTVNANNTFVVSDTPGDILTLIPGAGISIVGDALNDTITIGATATGTGASVNVGNTPPESPQNGDLWWNSDLVTLFIYYADSNSSQWVDTSTAKISSGTIVNGGSTDLSAANAWTNTVVAGANAWVNSVYGFANTQIGVAFNKANTANIIGSNTAIEFIIDGAGSTITTGDKGYLEIPFSATLTRWTILADQVGSANVMIEKAPYAAFPPVAANSINNAGFTLSTQNKNQGTLFEVNTITAGDILAYEVISASAVTRLTVSLRATKT